MTLYLAKWLRQRKNILCFWLDLGKIMGIKNLPTLWKEFLNGLSTCQFTALLVKTRTCFWPPPFRLLQSQKKILFLDTTALCKFCWILFSKNIVVFHRSFDDACFIITSKKFVWKNHLFYSDWKPKFNKTYTVLQYQGKIFFLALQ